MRLHKEGILHGSLADRNIMVQPGPLNVAPAGRSLDTPSFRVIDFGRARICEQGDDEWRTGLKNDISCMKNAVYGVRHDDFMQSGNIENRPYTRVKDGPTTLESIAVPKEDSESNDIFKNLRINIDSEFWEPAKKSLL